MARYPTNPHEILRSVKGAIREPYAWPGGYEKRIYLSDGETICQDCVRKEWRNIVQSTLNGYRDGWAAMAVDVHWEGPPEQCAHCNKVLPSVYGDPDAVEPDDLEPEDDQEIDEWREVDGRVIEVIS